MGRKAKLAHSKQQRLNKQKQDAKAALHKMHAAHSLREFDSCCDPDEVFSFLKPQHALDLEAEDVLTDYRQELEGMLLTAFKLMAIAAKAGEHHVVPETLGYFLSKFHHETLRVVSRSSDIMAVMASALTALAGAFGELDAATQSLVIWYVGMLISPAMWQGYPNMCKVIMVALRCPQQYELLYRQCMLPLCYIGMGIGYAIQSLLDGRVDSPVGSEVLASDTVLDAMMTLVAYTASTASSDTQLVQAAQQLLVSRQLPILEAACCSTDMQLSVATGLLANCISARHGLDQPLETGAIELFELIQQVLQYQQVDHQLVESALRIAALLVSGRPSLITAPAWDFLEHLWQRHPVSKEMAKLAHDMLLTAILTEGRAAVHAKLKQSPRVMAKIIEAALTTSEALAGIPAISEFMEAITPDAAENVVRAQLFILSSLLRVLQSPELDFDSQRLTAAVHISASCKACNIVAATCLALSSNSKVSAQVARMAGILVFRSAQVLSRLTALAPAQISFVVSRDRGNVTRSTVAHQLLVLYRRYVHGLLLKFMQQPQEQAVVRGLLLLAHGHDGSDPAAFQNFHSKLQSVLQHVMRC